jgi:Holliday junction resolvasome RuvABC endonuclease subunit
MSAILAIDPGSERTGWLVYEPQLESPVTAAVIEDNDQLLGRLRQLGESRHSYVVAIEWMTPRGMPTSAQEFETLFWIGRFTEACDMAAVAVHRVERGKVKDHICGSRKANDANIRQALIDRFGGPGGKAAAVGTKAAPGPLHGLSSHLWAALGVAVTYAEGGHE